MRDDRSNAFTGVLSIFLPGRTRHRSVKGAKLRKMGLSRVDV